MATVKRTRAARAKPASRDHDDEIGIVINRCWGGFSISLECARWMAERGHKQAKAEIADFEERRRLVDYKLKNDHWPDGSDSEMTRWLESDVELSRKYPDNAREFPCWYGYGRDGDYDGYERDDPLLVAAIEVLGPKANNRMSKLEIVRIPRGVKWKIDDYDGMEKVCEVHREW